MTRGRFPGLDGTGVWRNWAASAISRPGATAAPRSEDEITARLVAANEAGTGLKVVGGGHSFTPLAATDGMLLNLDGYTGIIHVETASRRVRFRAGTRLRDVAALLQPYGLALANMGDIDHQSLAGAISTSTHGTGLGLTGFSGMVTALRLVLPDGTARECSADSNPDLFQAARVGLGALGVLTEVTIQCVPRFKLRALEAPESLAGMLESFVERCASTDHLEFYWFPHTEVALAKTNVRLDDSSPAHPLPLHARIIDDELLGNGAFGLTCRLGSSFPAMVPGLNRFAAGTLAARSYTDQSERVFTAPRRVRFREMEYAIPLETLPEAFAEVRKSVEAYPQKISFPLEVRAAAADNTWLGTASGRDTAYIAVHRYAREPAGPFLAGVEQVFKGFAGRPHWGKLHTRDASFFVSAYPHFADFLAQRAAADPQGTMLNEHLSHILGVGRTELDSRTR
ncbi:D-arabinono-1,4-lactone oxidase [Paeniglutamicibacter gangotriensis]|uniref:FAD-linked oxidoreductase n=1 Tax=Paeniglutamicibacter gangotriensis Lz1y TaxID=1276920 RepID=M7MKV4_9MICC|nr:D-arabinono-1,4-lactone oxidase [Paeniglutamicibacter gangotriensis]EMQ96957.1 FAD-linked oxidoreductase [Paeniglutamicibacter gangotriensis Lz1y]